MLAPTVLLSGFDHSVYQEEKPCSLLRWQTRGRQYADGEGPLLAQTVTGLVVMGTHGFVVDGKMQDAPRNA
jgi:hypothetical protein